MRTKQPKHSMGRRYRIGDERIALVDGETHAQVVEALHGSVVVWSTERVRAEMPVERDLTDTSIVATKAARENGWRDYQRHLEASKSVLRALARQGVASVELASGLVVECAR